MVDAKWQSDISEITDQLIEIAAVAGIALKRSEIEIEFLPAPHRPPAKLPTSKMAIYAFWGDGCWLKIGKVGAQSNARYTSQHYNPDSARSTLASSLMKDEVTRQFSGSEPKLVGSWIKEHCSRANILFDARLGIPLLSLCEAFIHVRLKPRYEG